MSLESGGEGVDLETSGRNRYTHRFIEMMTPQADTNPASIINDLVMTHTGGYVNPPC